MHLDEVKSEIGEHRVKLLPSNESRPCAIRRRLEWYKSDLLLQAKKITQWTPTGDYFLTITRVS